MDPNLFKEMVTYLKNGAFPPGFTNNQKSNFRRKAKSFDLQDEQLYYIRHKGKPQSLKAKVLCGEKEANEVFQDFHASSGGAHCGQKKNRDAISQRFYWPGMSEDIDLWVSQCVACQASQAVIKKEVKFTPIKVTQTFELIGMDLIGKLKITPNGNQYICVMVDYLTKWPQAYALKSKSAEEVSQCILKFFYQFEAPKRILTDQGSEFVNEINKNVCQILGIKRSLCAPYHPQTNGLVERLNGTIQRALSKLVKTRPEEWDKHLDAVMFGLRTKRQMTAKFSPFFLMFGREARYPSQIPGDYRVDTSVENNLSVEEVTEEILNLDNVLLTAISNTTKAQSKRNKNKEGKDSLHFHVGMKVWRMNIRSQQRKGGKLDPNYLGPYTIATIVGKSVDLVDSQGVNIPKISMDHLVAYIEEQPRVPHKCHTNATTTSSLPTSTAQPISVSSLPTSTAQPITTSSLPTSTAQPISVSSLPTSTAQPITTSSLPTSTAQPIAVSALPTSKVNSTIKNVRDAWNGKDKYILLSKVGPYKILFSDIYNTAPGQRFESEVINAYLAILVRNFNRDNNDRALVIETFEMTRIWEGKKSNFRIDPILYKYIVGVVNQDEHWMLVVILPGQKRSLFLDPLGEGKRKIKHCQNITRSFMRQRGLNISRWTCDTLPHPCQQDATSCGAFVLKFAECILADLPVTFDNCESSVNDIRQQIAVFVVENTDDLNDLCHVCGNKDGDTHWIGCAVCPRWYHRNCLGKLPMKQKKLICKACE